MNQNINPKYKSRSIDGFIAPTNKPIKPKINHPPTKIVDNTAGAFNQQTKKVDLLSKAFLAPVNQQEQILNRNLVGNLSKPSKLNHRGDKLKRPRKKLSKKKTALLSVLAVFVIVIGLIGADLFQLYHKVHHINVNGLSQSVGGAENILVAGSTNRCNLKVQNAQWGFCSDGVTGINSDIIFIVHVVPATKSVSVLSIPRDTFVPNARKGNEAFKIDAALYEGPTQLVNAVEEDFGIPIQHYIEVGFDGFVNIVNALGGIKIDFPMPVYDAESHLNVQTPGCYKLNGVQALQVIRARHLQYKAPGITTNNVNYWPQENESDIARISRTHEFLRILASDVASRGIDNPITDQNLINAMAPQVQIDSAFSIANMISLMKTFHGLNFSSVPQYTLPVVVTNFGSYYFEGEDFGYVVFPYQNTDQNIIDKFLGTTSSINTMTGKPLPDPATVRVNVINGSGVSGQATQVSSGLQSLGFNIASQPSTNKPVSTQAQETVVYYSNMSDIGDALAVARDLSSYVIISKDAHMVTSGSNVTVLTGTGASVSLPTPTSSTSSTANSNTSSSQASSASSSSGTVSLGSLSSADQPLKSYDPKACTPNQKVMVNTKV